MRAGARFSVCVDGDEAFIEEYGMEDEGSEWRRVGAPAASAAGAGRAGRAGAGQADRPAAAGPPQLGDDVQVEVAEDDRTCWRPAKVRRLADGGRFVVCVDGDEDFIEEYGMEDEGREWRRKPANQRAATEWLGHTLVRPRPPPPSEDFVATLSLIHI